MKVTVNRKEFLKALKAVKPVAEVFAGCDRPGYVVLATDVTQMGVQGCGVGLFIQEIIGADCKVDGEVAVLFSSLWKIVKASKGEKISVEHKAQDVDAVVKTGACSYKVPIGIIDDMPIVPVVSTSAWLCEVDSEVLSKMLDVTAAKVRYSWQWGVGDDCSILKVEPGGKLSIVATDGYRLSIVSTTINAAKKREEQIVISNDVLMEVKKMSGSIQAALDGRVVVFQTTNRRIVHRLSESVRFPEVGKILAIDNKISYSMDRKQLLDAVSAVRVLLSPKEGKVWLDFSSKQERLELTSRDPDAGEGEATVPCVAAGEGEIVVVLKAAYVVEFLKLFKCDRIEAKLKDGNNVVMWSPEELPEGIDEYRHYIMPCRK